MSNCSPETLYQLTTPVNVIQRCLSRQDLVHSGYYPRFCSARRFWSMEILHQLTGDRRYREQVRLYPYPSLLLGRGLEKCLRILDFISNWLEWETRIMPCAIKKSEPRTSVILSSWKDHWQPRFPPSVKWGQTYVCPLEEFSVGLIGELVHLNVCGAAHRAANHQLRTTMCMGV